ncbi:AIPR family protein [Nocardiopsis lambiniae]|uniref:AIPR family protein n=1 Tax=Nocardiopsis lambiniae TaxID=3075539 RepID=A0ABU2MD27_9ACTN|nr:AIPR family protein [Nocardiopsis sp. DSM 44743]MDT0330020.1 AIPR family protein [Nocardiopsis sp. DSM 44743]
MQRLADAHAERALRQIKFVLNRDFAGRIDMGDYEGKQPQEREKAFLSRGLAALATRGVTGWNGEDRDEQAAMCVIDGRDDHGIDAIAVSGNTSEIWLVQSKWSPNGRASLDQAAALKFIRGWKLLEKHEYDRFNKRVNNMAERIRAVLNSFQARVHFVVAVTGPGDLHPDVLGVFDEEFTETNGFGLTLDLQVLDTHRLWEQVRVEEAPEDQPIRATMGQWLYRHEPVELYQGFVRADQVAAWYSEAGRHLFRRNIRDFLGGTEVNSEIADTVIGDPDLFLHLHSGITVICDSLDATFPETRKQSRPVELTLHNASVIDGAQSVTALHRAMLDDSEALAQALVSVNVICTGKDGSDPGLPTRITRARNRQNPVKDRDFVSLDRTQSLIDEEFSLRGLQYTYRRGEPDPAPEQGCSVVEAAIALACAHPNPRLVVRAKQNVDTLWERGEGSTYGLLFGERLGAAQVWGSVRLRRAVGNRLHELSQGLRGRGFDLADRGDLLIAHLVFQCVDRKEMNSDEYDWDEAVAAAVPLTDRAMPWLMHHIDAAHGSDSPASVTRVLSDPTRCRELSELTLRDLRSGAAAPPVSTDYRAKANRRPRKARRPNSVTILLNAGELSPGTPLEYRPLSATESAAMRDWLTEDPRRVRATWTNNRKYPLLWEADGGHHSPSGLVMTMYELAGWEDSPVAVQGPARWYIDGERMDKCAERVFQELGEEE